MEMYKFVGKGAGVPGLPHTVSRKEAKRRGVEEILNAAIKNGNYELIGGTKDVPVIKDIPAEPEKKSPKKGKGAK
jgi:hypothetical protein